MSKTETNPQTIANSKVIATINVGVSPDCYGNYTRFC
jgi:hypothetical protein